MDDCEALERATLAAVPPQAQEDGDGWLLAFDHGTVGRAHSAAPLRHTAGVADGADRVIARYGERGFRPVLRLPDLPAFGALQARLAQRGFAAGKPTLVQWAPAKHLAVLGDPARVVLHAEPGAAWSAVFLGEGFDPVDGASRVAILQRGTASRFAGVLQAGRTVAVGAGCYSHGWCGVHGMRTLPAWRGRGHAGAIIAALGGEATRLGIDRVFLQVEEANTSARALYARAGFTTLWRYRYWQALP